MRKIIDPKTDTILSQKFSKKCIYAAETVEAEEITEKRGETFIKDLENEKLAACVVCPTDRTKNPVVYMLFHFVELLDG